MRFFYSIAIIFVAVILGLSLTARAAFAAVPSPSPAVSPYVDPFSIQGCEDTTQVCHVPEQFTADRYRLSKLVEKALGVFSQLVPIAQFFGIQADDLLNWAGLVTPDKSYKVSTPQHAALYKQIHDSVFNDLDPAPLQGLQKENQQQIVYTKNGILCVSNPQTHESLGEFKSEEVWNTSVSVPIPNATQGYDGTRFFDSIVGGHTQGIDFNLPVAHQKKITTPSCTDVPGDGKLIEQSELPYEKNNQYGNPDAKTEVQWAVAEAPAKITHTEVGGNKAKKNSSQDSGTQYSYKASMGVPGTIVQGGYQSYVEQQTCGYAGCVPEDLKDASYITPEQKKNLVSNGSALTPYLNGDQTDSFFARLRDAVNEQTYAQTITNEPITTNSLHYGSARLLDGGTWMNCSLTNAGVMQDQLIANGFDCNMSLPGSSTVPSAIASIPPSEVESRLTANASVPSASAIAPNFAKHPSGSGIQKAIENAAANGQIPSCVLEAVAMIEGGYTGDYTCKPDSCGAVGPFQISVGICNQCKASACPNVLPKTMTPADMCNTDKSAGVAVNVLKGKAKYFRLLLSNADPKTQKQAIIIAGDSYNGTTKPLSRLKSTTNQTLSYGEWVYAHCDPTYTTHVDHQFPK